MKSEIQTLTIICQQGTKAYTVGSTYEGLFLDRIEDNSVDDGEGVFAIIYRGFTEGAAGAIVFEVSNAPIEVAYRATP